MTCKWQTIWNNRVFNPEVLKTNNQSLIFKELKRVNGFDVIAGGLTIPSLLKQHAQIMDNFAQVFDDNDFSHITSIYEVGCGSGGNLYLFNKMGLRVGGIDYSQTLINIAQKVLNTDDLTCAEAINMDIKGLDKSQDSVYDVILSNSVFSYFPDFEYAYQVLEKMYNKCKYAIGLIDVHDIQKMDEFIKYRKAHVDNYDEKYKGLDKLFYSKEFFIDFAKVHDMSIKFVKSDIDGYWNNDYIFNCYMYKR